MTPLHLILDQGPLWFCLALGATLFFSFLLEQVATRFVKDKARRVQRFSIMDLEFPADKEDIERILCDILRLGEERALQIRRALRTHLYLDYLFMPGAFGAIFLLCMMIAGKFPSGSPGQTGFALLAWAQLAAWACDFAENSVLLRQIRKDPRPMGQFAFTSFVTLVWAKWIIALAGIALGLSMAGYFWLKGGYGAQTLGYIGIAGMELAAFLGMRALWKYWRKG